MIPCPKNKLKDVSVGSGQPIPVKEYTRPWIDRFLHIIHFPAYLNEGFFMRQTYQSIPKNTVITIDVTGSAIIYVATRNQSHNGEAEQIDRSGGYLETLPKNGWKKEEGFIDTFDVIERFTTLNEIFSTLVKNETKISLPATSTDKTNMLIVVVSICEGKFYCSEIMPL